MEFFRPFTFLLVLLESFTLLPRNPKLLFFFSLFLLLLHSSLSFLRTKLLFKFQTIPLDPTSFLHILHAQFPAPPPTSSYLRRDLPLLLALQLAFAAAFTVVSFLSSLSTIVLASASYKSRTLSLRNFLAESCRACPRLLLTCLHVFALTLGYFALAAALSAPLLIHFNFNRLSVIPTAVIVVLLFNYLFVPLALSLPVAIVEENCYGLEALGKAATLISGKRVHGFLLNACFSGVVLGAIEIYRRTTSHHGAQVAWEIGTANLVFVVKILVDIAYTVLYYHCKRQRGEEIELYGGLRYDKLPAIMALSEDDEEEAGGVL